MPLQHQGCYTVALIGHICVNKFFQNACQRVQSLATCFHSKYCSIPQFLSQKSV